jgi:hypothetical protein
MCFKLFTRTVLFVVFYLLLFFDVVGLAHPLQKQHGKIMSGEIAVVSSRKPSLRSLYTLLKHRGDSLEHYSAVAYS